MSPEAASWAQAAILLLTAAVIFWYTLETQQLRKEMVRQNAITLRPLVLPEFAGDTAHRVFKLKNCGTGCALNVRVSPIEIPEAAVMELGPAQVRFEPAYYMAPGENLSTPARVWAAGQLIVESPFNNYFFPQYPGGQVNFDISYDDVEGGSYSIPVMISVEANPGHWPRQVTIGAVRSLLTPRIGDRNMTGWTRDQKIQVCLLVVGIFYGLITTVLWWTTREGIHSGQRAYLQVAKAKLTEPPMAGKGVRATFEIRNTGQTPALRMSATPIVGMFLGEPPLADSTPQSQTSDVAAGQAQTMSVALINPLTPGDIDDVTKEMYSLNDQTLTIAGRDRRLFVYGLVKYTDMFGGNDETEFCLVYLPKSMQSADGEKTFAECASPTRNHMK